MQKSNYGGKKKAPSDIYNMIHGTGWPWNIDARVKMIGSRPTSGSREGVEIGLYKNIYTHTHMQLHINIFVHISTYKHGYAAIVDTNMQCSE